jgi:tetratricopeptide (TPR) repeat protein
MSLIGIWFQTHIVIQNTVLHSAQEGFFWRLAVAGMAPWFYLYKALLPVDLAAIYPRWQVDAKSIVSFLPFLALVGVFLLFWRYRRGWGKPPLMAMGYVLVSLFPVLGFFDMYYQLFSLAADHWQYVAIVGTIALVTGLGWHLASGRTRPVQWAAGALAVAVVVTLSALTWRHAGVYRTKESLWGDNIAKYPQAWMAYFNLAGTLDKKGQPDEAVSLYQTCIKLNPRHEKAYINIGTILSRTEKFEEAAQYYAQAIRINPRSAMAHSNLGVMLHSVGRAQEALAELREAVRLDSRYFDAQSNLGTVLDTLGVEDQAIEHWKKALEVRDQNDVRLLLASLLAKQGKDREAVEQYCRIVSNDPNFTEGYFQLGLLRTRMGQLGQAKDDFLRVLQMKGDHVDAHNNLAILYLKAGQLDQAVRHFRLAIRSQPDHPNANYNLAFLLASNGLMRESLGYYYRAIQAKADWPEPRITLARVLASCTDDGVRNGPEALRLAEEACRLTRYSRADALDALAAAYAELGRFGDAAKAANKAVELARAAGQNDFAADIAARAQLYTASRPWRRPPPAVNPVVAAALAS